MSERGRLRQISNDILLQFLPEIVPFEGNVALDVPGFHGILIAGPSPESPWLSFFGEAYVYQELLSLGM
ncbi:MAG: hypothetical protein OXD43_09395 [Bacteroidetes bacterium]|nr:hypothetical protein [Bacteroidota bacterium]